MVKPANEQLGLVDFLGLVVCPALFERLDRAFPEFGWTRTDRGWKATDREFTKATYGVRPELVVCTRPFGFTVYGKGTTSWTTYVNRGTAPTGQDFLEAGRKLAKLAGVAAPALSGAGHQAEAREEAVEEAVEKAVDAHSPHRPEELAEAFLAVAKRALRSEAAGPVRACLAEKWGLDAPRLKNLPLGFYSSPGDMKSRLGEAGVRPEETEAFGLLGDARWTGHLVGVIRDPAGRLVRFWGWDIRGKPDAVVRCFDLTDLDQASDQVHGAPRHDAAESSQPGRPEEPPPAPGGEREPPSQTVRDVAEEVEMHTGRLDHYAGREFLGLPQRVLEGLDEATLGLRGLVLLAAGANVGRTTLALQLGTDVVVHNQDACLLFVSLEMSRWDILTRIKSRLAGMDWKRLVLGSRKGPDEAAYTLDEVADMLEAEQMLARIGRRVRILDRENCPVLTADAVLENLRQLEAKSGARRAFVVVDHLQLWPAGAGPAQGAPPPAGLADAQAAAVARIRDAVPDGAVMAVVDVRGVAAGSRGAWWDELASVTGACHGDRGADMAFCLRPFDEGELRAAYAQQHGDASESGSGPTRDAVRQWKRTLQERDGITLNKLTVAGGRDGVEKGELDLTFHFRRSEFEEGLPQWDGWRAAGTRLAPGPGRRWKSIAR